MWQSDVKIGLELYVNDTEDKTDCELCDRQMQTCPRFAMGMCETGVYYKIIIKPLEVSHAEA